MQRKSYTTEGGIRVEREVVIRDYDPADRSMAAALDTRRGVWFSSSFEFPGRYTRWDMGFVDPPLSLTARSREFWVEALNERGGVLLGAVGDHLADLPSVDIRHRGEGRIDGEILSPRAV